MDEKNIDKSEKNMEESPDIIEEGACCLELVPLSAQLQRLDTDEGDCSQELVELSTQLQSLEWDDGACCQELVDERQNQQIQIQEQLRAIYRRLLQEPSGRFLEITGQAGGQLNVEAISNLQQRGRQLFDERELNLRQSLVAAQEKLVSLTSNENNQVAIIRQLSSDIVAADETFMRRSGLFNSFEDIIDHCSRPGPNRTFQAVPDDWTKFKRSFELKRCNQTFFLYAESLDQLLAGLPNPAFLGLKKLFLKDGRLIREVRVGSVAQKFVISEAPEGAIFADTYAELFVKLGVDTIITETGFTITDKGEIGEALISKNFFPNLLEQNENTGQENMWVDVFFHVSAIVFFMIWGHYLFYKFF